MIEIDPVGSTPVDQLMIDVSPDLEEVPVAQPCQVDAKVALTGGGSRAPAENISDHLRLVR